MSILIKDMKKPRNCHECPFLYVTSICDGFKDCPIVNVPAHGDLIDRVALERHAVTEWFCGNKRINVPWKAVADAPTVIEAEDK